MQFSPVLTRVLLSNLFLLALLPIVTHGQAVGKAHWTFIVERGEVKRAVGSIGHKCSTPNHFRVTSSEVFFRFEPRADFVFFGPGATNLLGIIIDASRLKPKTYRLKAMVKCLDCQRPKCYMEQGTILIDVTVVEPTPRRQEESSRQKSDVERIGAALKNELKRVSAAFKDRVRRLRSIAGVTYRGGVKVKVEGYVAGEVLAVIEETKRELLHALEPEALHPFRDYVEKHFPLPKLTTVSVETGRATTPSAPKIFSHSLQTSFYAARAPSETRVVATVESAEEAFANVGAFVAWVESNSGEFTLKLDSEPDGANVELRRVDGVLVHTNLTNVAVPGFFPGIYVISVKKDGFLGVEQRQELGAPLTTIMCKLVTSGTPQYCQLR